MAETSASVVTTSSSVGATSMTSKPLSRRASQGARLLRNSRAPTTIRPGGRSERATVAAASETEPSRAIADASLPMSWANRARVSSASRSHSCQSKTPDSQSAWARSNAARTGRAAGGAVAVFR